MHKFHIVDVFGEKKYSGNQLAVVLPGDPIPDARLQKIAAEFNFPETSFITRADPVEGGYNARIFTPRKEVPFAGHPTLGTAYVIRKELVKSDVAIVNLNLKIGRIPVEFAAGGQDLLWMRQINPTFGRIFDREEIARLIEVSKEEIDGEFPIQEVFTGVSFVIIPLVTLASVKKSRLNMTAYKNFSGKNGDLPIFVFCPEAEESANQIHCRMFAPAFGIPEDPATGSANGCLAGYLLKHRFFSGDTVEARVEQGYEIGRKSILHLRAAVQGDRIDIQVGGKVIEVAEGRLL